MPRSLSMSAVKFALAALLAAGLSACGGDTNTLTGACSPACASGELCESGVCKSVSDAGTGCTSDSQCSPGVCNMATGACVASLCSPACPAWETCSGRACELSPGRCNSNTDCPSSLPICASNTCTAPQVTAPATQTYAALIVTNRAYAQAFGQIALMHSLTGVPTKVATVEDICAAAAGGCSTSDACHDAPKAIKDFLITQAAAGITQVVIGGDSAIVPGRSTHAHYQNALYGGAFDEDMFSDDYYGDLTEWDTNHDCVYGDAASDSPAFVPTLGISRISVSSQAELQAYFTKEQAYLTAYDTSRLNTALFLSNVAADLTVPVLGDVQIDSALYFETPGRTLSYIPSGFDITKLYSSLGNWPGAQPLTVPAEITALEAGYNLVVHSGHGDEVDVTVEQDGNNEFSGDMAYGLQNTQYPVMVSCACDAATFADGDTCAGQQFITAPTGGGIGYLGNAATGLGIAGGMQLLDQFLAYAFAHTNPLIGDAVRAAHVNMPTSDGLTIHVAGIGIPLSVVDTTSWQWTQKAATYLGDGLLPIYTDVTLTQAPSFTAQRTAIGDFSQVTFTPSTGAVGTLAVSIGASVYELPMSGGSAPLTLTVPGNASQVTYGFSSATTLAAYKQISLP